ncbi:coiled-coil domain-containing protein, partial [Cellulomonas rhizosphaerae]
MTHGNRSRRRPFAGGLVTAIALGAMLVGGAPLASADPTPPSDQDVRDARAAVQDASQSVAQMEVRLAELSVTSDAAELRVQQAGEAYTQALVDAQDAQGSADEAADAAQKAADDAEQARRTLVAIAREMARSGGSVDMIESLLSADGFQDVAQRTSALDRVSGKADEAVQEFRAATLVAGTLQEHAAASAKTATQKSKDAAASLRSAEKTQKDADDAVAAAGAERDALISNLAAARSTSVAVERARQDQLDAERRQRADDEAREAHEDTSSNGGGGNGGNGTTDDPPTTTDPGTTDPGKSDDPPATDPDPEPTDEPTA